MRIRRVQRAGSGAERLDFSFQARLEKYILWGGGWEKCNKIINIIGTRFFCSIENMHFDICKKVTQKITACPPPPACGVPLISSADRSPSPPRATDNNAAASRTWLRWRQTVGTLSGTDRFGGEIGGVGVAAEADDDAGSLCWLCWEVPGYSAACTVQCKDN
jgi:hypothetical protein